jgi:3-oxoacyl-[acyl-carrier protein] reductase
VNYAKSAGAADEVVRAIRDAGGKALAVKADVSDPTQIPPLFASTRKAFGRLDILVNNAGVHEALPLTEVTVDHYSRLFDINVRGLLLASAEAARQIGNEGGRIINITSGAARMVVAGMSVYSATKAAVESLTRVHADELGSRKITVNAVAPGATDTDMLRAGLPEEGKQFMIQKTALGRLGTPEDIADVVAFLASDDARWITGQFIDVNGGLHV